MGKSHGLSCDLADVYTILIPLMNYLYLLAAELLCGLRQSLKAISCQWPPILTHLWPIKLTHPVRFKRWFFASVDSFLLPA